MIETIKKFHKWIFDNFDLGSCLTISISILENTVILTNSNERKWGIKCSIYDIPKHIAETILLHLQSNTISYGSWATQPNLPKQCETILDYKEEDFYLNLELEKLWTITRVICNIDREKNVLYQIDYSAESDITCFKKYSSKEQIEKYLEDYLEE